MTLYRHSVPQEPKSFVETLREASAASYDKETASLLEKIKAEISQQANLTSSRSYHGTVPSNQLDRIVTALRELGLSVSVTTESGNFNGFRVSWEPEAVDPVIVEKQPWWKFWK